MTAGQLERLVRIRNRLAAAENVSFEVQRMTVVELDELISEVSPNPFEVAPDSDAG